MTPTHADLPSPPATLAVIVTYHPDDGLDRRVAAALEHARRVLVVDNTPGGRPQAFDALPETPTVTVHRMGRNAGIASALNYGLSMALRDGFGWTLMLDHDTTLRDNYLTVVRSAIAGCPRRVGLVGVNFESTWTGRRYVEWDGASGGEAAREVPFLVSSGSMLRTECLREIGPLRDDYFIDYVDVEYGLRVRRHGYAVVLALEPAMDHGMAEIAESRVLGYSRPTSNYRPVRHYYMARNLIATAREYGRAEGGWLRREAVERAKLTALTLVMEPRRLRKLACMARGYLDGVRGRMGEAPATVR